MSEQAQIEKGLKHLAGSEEIIGNIVAYCVNAHKADPSAKTMDKIRQYVSDTANSVCGHVLTIAHNINSIIDKESKEIEEMSYQVSYVQHRLKSHQTYMSQLYMTKFQTLPRPKPTIHILRETIPTEKLPKYARPKKPWVRQGIFDYSILDQVGSGKKPRPKPTPNQEGNNSMTSEMKKQKTLTQIQPKAAVQAFNPYESMMNDNKPSAAPKLDASSSASKSNNLQASSPKSGGKSLYQQEKEAKLKKVTSSNAVGAPPPSFSGAAPPSFSQASSKKKPSGGGPPAVPKGPPKPPQPPQPPQQQAVPPPVPGGPPAPPVPPQPPQ